jgi:hypothetical protein
MGAMAISFMEAFSYYIVEGNHAPFEASEANQR